MRLELTSVVLGLLSEVNYPLTNRLPKPLLILFRLLLRICYDIIFETVNTSCSKKQIVVSSIRMKEKDMYCVLYTFQIIYLV